MREVKCDLIGVVFDLLREGIPPAGKAPHAHSHELSGRDCQDRDLVGESGKIGVEIGVDAPKLPHTSTHFSTLSLICNSLISFVSNSKHTHIYCM
jgi:hypothetical protein